MTTTELIKLLQAHEFGASGRSREITIYRDTKKVLSEVEDLKFSSSGDGCAGSELELQVVPREKLKTQISLTSLQELYKNQGVDISIQQLENMCNTFFEILNENKTQQGYNVGEYYSFPNINLREESEVGGIPEHKHLQDELKAKGIHIPSKYLSILLSNFKIMNKEIKDLKSEITIGDIVIYPDAYDTEEFEVVGIRKNELEICGDWSGGTHPIKASCWVDKNRVQFKRKS